ncbi:oligopeptide transporter substrate-binding protein [Mycobacterium sp. Aquia_213]|uniref:oligopeptide transporter substrate-binding protein n=1 Tax=Mycobacterium sp. Aquia_213 TaxID=2991728 RepID=UPI00226F39CC|nr:oligopeptide transporter substrate-binding protein [Mycobacterium sp. Aquia_213]WAC91136.1 oligopeptide transporter substrate-binding protein [Mycobacterium sp. Aquia_213]
MARHAPADYFVDDDPTVFIHYGDDDYGSAEPDPDDPIPGWRKPIALAGWGLLIAVLIALIVWGIIQLMHGAPPQEPVTNTTPVPTATTTIRPSSATSVAPPSEQATTTPTDAPTASTEDTPPSASTTTPTTPSREGYPLPQLPSVITLPALPGLPTEITLPPGL